MKRIVLALLFLTVSFGVFAQNKDAILGKWLSATGEAQIQVFKKGDKFFGKLVWLKLPNDENGKAKTDHKNPDESLRSRPVWGLEILKDFKADSDNKYTDGTIYDPKSGKTYSCKMTMNGDKLSIRGYIGISLIGRTEIWTRVKA